MKLKTRFLLIFLLISNIPVLIITSFTYNRYTHLIREQSDSISDAIGENAQETVNSIIESINTAAEIFQFYSESSHSVTDDLLYFTNTPPDPNDTSEAGQAAYDNWNYRIKQSHDRIQFLVENLIYTTDYINGIYVFTPSGVNLGYGNINNILTFGYEPFDDKWYLEASDPANKGRMFVSEISEKDYFTKSTESITFSKGLYDIYDPDLLLGVLVIDCTPDLFDDLSTVNTLPDTILLTVENDSGYVLYNNLDSINWKYSEGNTVTTSYELATPSLRLTATTNNQKLYEDFGVTRILIIEIALVCALIFIVASILLSNYLTRPIVHLSTQMAAQKMHTTPFHTKYLDRTDEVGILYNEYNNMLEELNTYAKNQYQNKLITLDSQMKSLEAQINSHFLYNTLESINSIAEIEEIESISIMSMALGNMFRYSIKTQSELVTVADELGHVNDYVVIQQIRFDNKFHLDIDIPEPMYELKVLKLILQPIVENALYHGLQYCNAGDSITIRGTCDAHNICFTITDNGVGMNEDELQDLQKKLAEEAHFTELGQRSKESIGLKNIHTRISLYYGRNYGLSISSNPGNGTTIEIRLPVM